jgi:cytochrome c553
MSKHVILISAAALLCLAGAAQAGDRVAGKAVYESKGCVACHGADGKTVSDPSYPTLAGQHADYLEHALRAYRRGAANAPASANIRKNAIMSGFAAGMTDKEIRDVSAYLATMPSDLGVRR